MARKIIDITDSASLYDILSQTPKNYNKNNYFLKELQDKVDAEWRFRPNRVDIEHEHWGTDVWEPMEVVIQTVKSEKGEAIADDVKNIVFKNILEDRFKLGSKFRFSPKFNLNDPVEAKNVWLGINNNQTTMTANMVIQRCNGSLGSTYVDEQGITHYHYEPVIQAKDITSTSFSYSEVSVSPQAHLVITAQYNQFTNKYFINQRFIIGAREEDPKNPGHFISGQVYRITAIDKDYGLSTWNPESVGLVKFYVELTEASVYDDWDSRIAYQNDQTIHLDTKSVATGYSIMFKTPTEIPVDLTSDELIFTPIIISDNGTEYTEKSQKIQTTFELENWPVRKPITDQNLYVELTESGRGVGETYTFALKRKKVYINGDLIVTCSIGDADSPSGSKISTSFKMVVRRQE